MNKKQNKEKTAIINWYAFLANPIKENKDFEKLTCTQLCTPNMFELESYVTGHHIYKDILLYGINQILFLHMGPEVP